MKWVPGQHRLLQPGHHQHYFSPKSIDTLLRRNSFDGVEFVHLRPVRARTMIGDIAKRGAFALMRGIDSLTRGRVNLDNLFVLARKREAPARG
jgi:hypothetical protein